MNTLKALHVILQRAAWFGVEHQDDRELSMAVMELELPGAEVGPNQVFAWACTMLQQEPPERVMLIPATEHPDHDHSFTAEAGTQGALIWGIEHWLRFLADLHLEAIRGDVGPSAKPDSIQPGDDHDAT